MPKGFFYIGWSDVQGPYVEMQYPNKSVVDDINLTSYLPMIQSMSSSHTLQLSSEDGISLLYGIPKKLNSDSNPYNYKFLILLLEKSERGSIPRYKSILNTMGKKIITSSRNERKKWFKKASLRIFRESVEKIVFMGRSNAGKTTARKFIFEKSDQEKLLETSLAPTQGVDISYYDLFDLNLSLFDTSGQSINKWYDLDEGVFPSADLIVYFFSVEQWADQQNDILENLKKYKKTFEENDDINPEIIVFCHKIDLIEKQELENFKRSVRDKIKHLEYPLFFTSLKQGGNQDLMIALQLVYKKFSDIIVGFNENIQPIFTKKNAAPIALFDKEGKILLRFKGPGYDFDKIKKFEGLLNDFTKSSENWFGEPLNQFAFEDKGARNLIFGLNFENIVHYFSYLLFRVADLSELSQIYRDYEELLSNHEWKSLQK